MADKDALFIDVDGTITRSRADAPSGPPGAPNDVSVEWLLREAAFLQKRINRQTAGRIIRDTDESTPWAHWTDLIRALDLDACSFWEYAYREACKYIEPVSEDLPAMIADLHKAGYLMFIASNNPSSGILLKLRVAGLAEMWGSSYFMQYLNPSYLRHSKDDPEFWLRALAQTGLNPARVVAIGDSWCDDVEAPLAAGIETCIHLDLRRGQAPQCEGSVWRVGSWRQIARLLLNDSDAAGRRTGPLPIAGRKGSPSCLYFSPTHDILPRYSMNRVSATTKARTSDGPFTRSIRTTTSI